MTVALTECAKTVVTAELQFNKCFKAFNTVKQK